MKTGAKVALSGVLCGMSVVFLLLTVLPTLEIGLPIMAGTVFIVLVLECGLRWAWMGYAVVSVLGMLLAPSMESRLLFVLFFGYYPMMKAIFERLPWKWVTWLCKLILFNGMMLFTYWLLLKVTSAVDVQDFTLAGIYLPQVILAFGNIVFVVYDIALTRCIHTYLQYWQPKLHQMFHF